MVFNDIDEFGNYSDPGHQGPGPELMGADTLIGDAVYNLQNEQLGEVKEIMLDMRTGKVAYVVMAAGGVFSLGERLFALPWDALSLDTVNKRFLLPVDKERIDKAPGFDADCWPNMANPQWASEIRDYYDSSKHS